MVTGLVTLVVFVIAVGLLVRWIEPRMAFYPLPGVQETPSEFRLPFTDVRIPTSDGETLYGWWLDDPEARAQVVYWHGNGGNLSVWADVIAGLRQHHLSVLAVDYRGYGASSGEPSERGLYRDADAALAVFASRLRRDSLPVMYWGRSIGSAVAAYSASRTAPDALVLESPFSDIRAILRNNPLLWAASFVSSYRFPEARFLERYRGPLLVIHGDADSVIPYSAGRALFDAVPTDRKTFVTIPGANHNDLHTVAPSLYWNSIDTWLRTLAK
jgi:fermentation-respiration switch protein FrsA (DUF1100 family)